MATMEKSDEQRKVVFETNWTMILNNLIPCNETYQVFVQLELITESLVQELQQKTATRLEKNTLIMEDIRSREVSLDTLIESLEKSGHSLLGMHLRTEEKREGAFDEETVMRNFPQLSDLVPSQSARTDIIQYVLSKFKECKALEWYTDNNLVGDAKPSEDLLEVKTKQKVQKSQGRKKSVGGRHVRVGITRSTPSQLRQLHDLAITNLIRFNDSTEREMLAHDDDVLAFENQIWNFFEQTKSFLKKGQTAPNDNDSKEVTTNLLTLKGEASRALQILLDRLHYLETCRATYELLVTEVGATLTEMTESSVDGSSLSAAGPLQGTQINNLLSENSKLKTKITQLEENDTICHDQCDELRIKQEGLDNLIIKLRKQLRKTFFKSGKLELEVWRYVRYLNKLLDETKGGDVIKMLNPKFADKNDPAALAQVAENTVVVQKLLRHSQEILSRKIFTPEEEVEIMSSIDADDSAIASPSKIDATMPDRTDMARTASNFFEGNVLIEGDKWAGLKSAILTMKAKQNTTSQKKALMDFTGQLELAERPKLSMYNAAAAVTAAAARVANLKDTEAAAPSGHKANPNNLTGTVAGGRRNSDRGSRAEIIHSIPSNQGRRNTYAAADSRDELRSRRSSRDMHAEIEAVRRDSRLIEAVKVRSALLLQRDGQNSIISNRRDSKTSLGSYSSQHIRLESQKSLRGASNRPEEPTKNKDLPQDKSQVLQNESALPSSLPSWTDELMEPLTRHGPDFAEVEINEGPEVAGGMQNTSNNRRTKRKTKPLPGGHTVRITSSTGNSNTNASNSLSVDILESRANILSTVRGMFKEMVGPTILPPITPSMPRWGHSYASSHPKNFNRRPKDALTNAKDDNFNSHNNCRPYLTSNRRLVLDDGTAFDNGIRPPWSAPEYAASHGSATSRSIIKYSMKTHVAGIARNYCILTLDRNPETKVISTPSRDVSPHDVKKKSPSSFSNIRAERSWTSNSIFLDIVSPERSMSQDQRKFPKQREQLSRPKKLPSVIKLPSLRKTESVCPSANRILNFLVHGNKCSNNSGHGISKPTIVVEPLSSGISTSDTDSGLSQYFSSNMTSAAGSSETVTPLPRDDSKLFPAYKSSVAIHSYLPSVSSDIFGNAKSSNFASELSVRSAISAVSALTKMEQHTKKVAWDRNDGLINQHASNEKYFYSTPEVGHVDGMPVVRRSFYQNLIARARAQRKKTEDKRAQKVQNGRQEDQIRDQRTNADADGVLAKAETDVQVDENIDTSNDTEKAQTDARKKARIHSRVSNRNDDKFVFAQVVALSKHLRENEYKAGPSAGHYNAQKPLNYGRQKHQAKGNWATVALGESQLGVKLGPLLKSMQETRLIGRDKRVRSEVEKSLQDRQKQDPDTAIDVASSTTLNSQPSTQFQKLIREAKRHREALPEDFFLTRGEYERKYLNLPDVDAARHKIIGTNHTMMPCSQKKQLQHAKSNTLRDIRTMYTDDLGYKSYNVCDKTGDTCVPFLNNMRTCGQCGNIFHPNGGTRGRDSKRRGTYDVRFHAREKVIKIMHDEQEAYDASIADDSSKASSNTESATASENTSTKGRGVVRRRRTFPSDKSSTRKPSTVTLSQAERLTLDDLLQMRLSWADVHALPKGVSMKYAYQHGLLSNHNPETSSAGDPSLTRAAIK